MYKTKEEAFEFAQKRAQETGTDYRVIKLENGQIILGTLRKLVYRYPNVWGWNFRYMF